MGSSGAAGGGGSVPGSSGARGGAAPGATGGRRGGGIALDFSRGKTSKDRLKIDWQFPVWKPPEPEVKDGHTVAVARYALPLEEAFRIIAGGDHRPLLVLRECELCKGTDHALLSRDLSNEQTMLLTYWFRCVKMPPHVLADDHPFYRLFEKPEGETVPHLFFASWNGSNVTALPGDQSQAELWDTMFEILEREYVGDAADAVKDLRKILNKYDAIDGMEREIKVRIDQEIDKRGPKSPKLKRLYEQLEEYAAQREVLAAEEKAIRDLALRSQNEKVGQK